MKRNTLKERLKKPKSNSKNREKVKEWALKSPNRLSAVLGFKNNHHHEEWYSYLKDEKLKRIVLLAPREHAKSTVFSVIFALYSILKNPNIRIIIVSNTATQAEQFLRQIVGIIETHELLIKLFGSLKPNRPEKWTDSIIIVSRDTLEKDPTVVAVGTGGPILSKRADLIICFPGHTKVETTDGNKNIRDVVIGDVVRTHTGEFHKVTKTYKRKWWGEMVEISTKYSKLKATLEHPFYVNDSWKDAEDIQIGDVLYRPRKDNKVLLEFDKRKTNNCHKIPKDSFIDSELAYWLGVYCADGGYRKNAFSVCFDDEEKQEIRECREFWERRFNVNTYTDTHNDWSTNVFVYSKSLTDKMVELFGRRSKVKRLHDIIFDLGDKEKASFILGLMSDSSKNESGAYTYSSASEGLRDDLIWLLKDLSITVTSVASFMSNNESFGGKSESFRLYINSIDAGKLRTIANDEYEVTSTKMSKNHTKYVYNLEVESDNSYIANGFAVHNCDDILNKENTRTPDQRKKVEEWFKDVLMPVLVKSGRLIWIATAFNTEDLSHKLLKNPMYHVKKVYRMVIKEADRQDLWDKYRGLITGDIDNGYAKADKFYKSNRKIMNAGAEVLWEDLYTYRDAVDKKIEVGTRSFNLMYQNNAVSDEDAIIKEAWVEQCKDVNRRLIDYFDQAVYDKAIQVITTGVDLAVSESALANETVIHTLAKTKGGKYVILNAVGGRWSPGETRGRIKQQNDRFKPSLILVENNAFQASMVKDLQNMTTAPIRGFTTTGEKFDPFIGINSMAVALENKQFIIPADPAHQRTRAYYETIKSEMTSFPSGHSGDWLMSLWFAFTAIRSTTTSRVYSFSGKNIKRGVQLT